jgi:uncharacterized RDD family membrane protein YckC
MSEMLFMADSSRQMARAVRYVGFWRRTLAFLLDTMIGILVLGIAVLLMYGRDYVDFYEEGRTFWFDLLFELILPAVATLLFWRFRGATPGKMLIGARIVDAKTLGRPSMARLVGRYFAYIISSFFMLGFLWIAVDARKQGWHDKLAGTVVVEEDID